MSRAFIVEGDAHSHGGHVLAGSEHAGIDGQAFACEGHPAICPLHGRTHIGRCLQSSEHPWTQGCAGRRQTRVWRLRSSLADSVTPSIGSRAGHKNCCINMDIYGRGIESSRAWRVVQRISRYQFICRCRTA
ncbi:PAAR domain-containing protein [Xanthomonas bromi]|nr:PAAR domain-containing protein [Xanthomonas bromi]